MAKTLLPEQMPSLTRRHHLYTAEELALLWREYEAWPLKGKNKAHGLMQHLQQVLPGCSWTSIKSQLRQMLRRGQIQRKRRTPRLTPPLQLTQAELGWLAGIVDGEGSFSLAFYKREQRRYGQAAVHCVLCYNNDEEIIREVQRLVPFVSVGTTNKAGTVSGRIYTRRDVRMVSTTSYAGAYEVLRAILPYLHGRKKAQALKVWEFVRPYVERTKA